MIKKTLYFGNPTYLSLRDRQLVIKLPEVEKNPDLPPSFKQNSEVTKPIEDIGIIVLDAHVCRTIDKLGMPMQITKEWKVELLSIPTLDVKIGGKQRPLMIAVTETTASLYRCFAGESRKISYPEM